MIRHLFLILGQLLPCWVDPIELNTFLTLQNGDPPVAMLNKTKPLNHVAYVDRVLVKNVLLAGPNTASLLKEGDEAGFVSELQHCALRAFLGLREGQFCFEWKHQSADCPLCRKRYISLSARSS
jgi:hypothetical protein